MTWNYCTQFFLMTCKVEKCCNQKSPSGMFAKLHTVAASNNRVHVPRSLSRTLVVTFNCSQVNISRASTPRSLLLLVCTTYIYIYCCSSHTSCSWWITHSTQWQQRGCNRSKQLLAGWFLNIWLRFLPSKLEIPTLPTQSLNYYLLYSKTTHPCWRALSTAW